MLKQCQTELASLKKDLPKLKAVADEAEKTFANSRQGRPVYPRDQIGPYSNAKARIDELSREIQRLHGLVNWEEGVKSASENVRLARKDIAKVHGEIKSLREKREKLESKRADLVKKHERELKIAERDEHEAAQAYAQAMGENDVAIERKAEGFLQKASHALAVIKQTIQGANTVSSALSAQLSELDDAIQEKQDELNGLNSKVLQAARFYWADRFEKAAHEMATLAAHVAAAEKLLGYGDSLTDFYIPNVSPEKGSFISHRRVLERRANIKLQQLTDF
jgi:DNA repair exonuclease SbcCD ATPase subunit